MEEKIKEMISTLRDQLSKGEILAVVYNPLKEEGMQEVDCMLLNHILENTKFTYPLIVLSGHGGDFSSGIYSPHIIEKKVKKYKVFVPRICGSALCYTLFKANELLIGENTKITQIDPMFKYGEEMTRAIEHLHSTNDELKNKSREAFDVAQEYVKKLILPPSVFNYKYMRPNEFQHVELIAVSFMKKAEHQNETTRKELDELEVEISLLNGTEADKIGNELIMTCQDYTIQSDVRVIFVSSIPIQFEKEGEGRFICPLD